MRTDTDNKDLLAPRGPGLLDRVLAAALRNRAVVLIATVLLMVWGLRSAQQLPIDAVPDVTDVQVQILTDSPGLSPLEVERLVTWPVETSMSGLPRTHEVRSVSRFGLSVVTVVFEEGTDLWWARQLVTERLADARESIPEGYGEPEIGPPSTGLGEVFQFEVRAADGADLTLMDLRDALEWQIAPRLRSVPGVVEVNTFGGELRTYQVEVRPERLAAHDLVLADVFDALDHNNLTVGGGYLERGREQMLVRGTALLETLDDRVKRAVASASRARRAAFLRELLLLDGACSASARSEAAACSARSDASASSAAARSFAARRSARIASPSLSGSPLRTYSSISRIAPSKSPRSLRTPARPAWANASIGSSRIAAR